MHGIIIQFSRLNDELRRLNYNYNNKLHHKLNKCIFFHRFLIINCRTVLRVSSNTHRIENRD